MAAPDPNDIGAGLALVKMLDRSAVPIFVALVIGHFGWMSWVTWGLRQIRQTGDDTNKSLASALSLALEIKGDLTNHRLEDTDHFARVDERIKALSDKESFWQRIAEDRSRLQGVRG
jgi:hypothetical protein